jgi:Sec-independent protein secretion pathway component TatC
MSFGDHIEELRRHLILALVGLGIAFLITLWYGRDIFSWIYAPLDIAQNLLDLPRQTYPRSGMGTFTVYLRVVFTGSLVLSGPWILYQIWLFISAGLYETERRAAVFLVALSSIMTTFAVLLTYYVFLPAMLVFLLMFSTSYPIPHVSKNSWLGEVTEWMREMNHKTLLPNAPGGRGDDTQPASEPAAAPMIIPTLAADPPNPVEGEIWYNTDQNEVRIFQDGRIHVVNMTAPSMMVPLIDPSVYLDEVLMLTLGVVLVFHVPVVMCVLGMTGLMNPRTLRTKRRYVIFGCFAAALVLTPSQDLFSNVMLPLMAWGLFELGLLLMAWFYRKHEQRLAAEEALAE